MGRHSDDVNIILLYACMYMNLYKMEWHLCVSYNCVIIFYCKNGEYSTVGREFNIPKENMNKFKIIPLENVIHVNIEKHMFYKWDFHALKQPIYLAVVFSISWCNIGNYSIFISYDFLLIFSNISWITPLCPNSQYMRFSRVLKCQNTNSNIECRDGFQVNTYWLMNRLNSKVFIELCLMK